MACKILIHTRVLSMRSLPMWAQSIFLSSHIHADNMMPLTIRSPFTAIRVRLSLLSQTAQWKIKHCYPIIPLPVYPESFYLTAAAGSSSCIRWQAIPLTKSAITKIIFTHYAVCTTIFILHIQKRALEAAVLITAPKLFLSFLYAQHNSKQCLVQCQSSVPRIQYHTRHIRFARRFKQLLDVSKKC